jgi:hypothetical protein
MGRNVRKGRGTGEGREGREREGCVSYLIKDFKNARER